MTELLLLLLQLPITMRFFGNDAHEYNIPNEHDNTLDVVKFVISEFFIHVPIHSQINTLLD